MIEFSVRLHSFEMSWGKDEDGDLGEIYVLTPHEFVSKVYKIRNGQFLIFDPYKNGFIWVPFYTVPHRYHYQESSCVVNGFIVQLAENEQDLIRRSDALAVVGNIPPELGATKAMMINAINGIQAR